MIGIYMFENKKNHKKYIGQIINVKITDVKTWSMDGEIVE